ncbi:hypothetical protein GQX74_015534 [Glossina fuscipes]|nr:hypothetical protein GQX74_015534 [Glossina fuscipes]
MVSSRDLKNLLKAYDYCIDEDHRTFFLKMIDELRIYNNLFTSPFISSSIYEKYHENSAKLNHIIKLLFLREMSIEIE